MYQWFTTSGNLSVIGVLRPSNLKVPSVGKICRATGLEGANNPYIMCLYLRYFLANLMIIDNYPPYPVGVDGAPFLRYFHDNSLGNKSINESIIFAC